MVKVLVFTFFSILDLFCLAQPSQFVNYKFRGVEYNAISIPFDSSFYQNISLLKNASNKKYDDFLTDVLSTYSNFILINASITDTSCNPIGYFVENGKEFKPPNLKDGVGNFYLKPNGALIVQQNDINIIESSHIGDYQNIVWAIQSGPLLYNNGILNKSINERSANRYIRCGVGIYIYSAGIKTVVFAISKVPVSFFDLAEFFRIKFRCRDVLCLESNGCNLYFPGIDTPSSHYKGIICNFILFQY